MAEWVLDVTDEDIDAALERARLEPDPVRALSAEYSPANDVVILRLDNGRRLVLPREELQGLQSATSEQLAEIQIFSGQCVSWPQLDVDLNLESLMVGRYGSEKWMKSLQRETIAA